MLFLASRPDHVSINVTRSKTVLDIVFDHMNARSLYAAVCVSPKWNEIALPYLFHARLMEALAEDEHDILERLLSPLVQFKPAALENEALMVASKYGRAYAIQLLL